MAELHIEWSDGRQEARAFMPRQIVTLGDSREPILPGNDEIQIGKPIILNGQVVPYCRVRLHGAEIPFIMLVVGDRRVFDGVRKRRGK